MKIIFMGTPEIAVASLEALFNDGHEVALVVTKPDKPKGRSAAAQSSPVKEYAESKGLKVYQPETLKNNQEADDLFKSIAPDFYAVVAYGKILPQSILDIPKIAPINVHFSLLPKYRGAAPVNWAIINGEELSGVSTMLMDAGMDTGDILLMKDTPIAGKTAQELSAELAVSGAALLIKTIKNFDIITPLKQDDNLCCMAPMMSKELGVIDWLKPAKSIEQMIRGLYPWPAAYSKFDGKLMKLFKAEVVELNTRETPGVIIDVSKDDFTVATGAEALKVLELQLEGKKRMSTKSFLTGFTVTAGMKLE